MRNTLACFNWFSLIWARNGAPLLLLDSLFIEEFFEKKWEFYSASGTGWEPVQPVLQKNYGQPSNFFNFFLSSNPLRLKPIFFGALGGHLKGLSLCLV